MTTCQCAKCFTSSLERWLDFGPNWFIEFIVHTIHCIDRPHIYLDSVRNISRLDGPLSSGLKSDDDSGLCNTQRVISMGHSIYSRYDWSIVVTSEKRALKTSMNPVNRFITAVRWAGGFIGHVNLFLSQKSISAHIFRGALSCHTSSDLISSVTVCNVAVET